MVDNDVHQINEKVDAGPVGKVEPRAPYPIDAGENFIMEEATDPNDDASFTFENIGNYSNADMVTESGDVAYITIEGDDGGNILMDGTDSDGTDAGDQIQQDNTGRVFIVLDGLDSSSTGAGHRILGESVVQYDFFTLSDIIKPSLLVLDSHIDVGLGRIGGSTPVSQTAIILEESNESGFFMQENETTASGAHGDNILLESKTGFGNNNKLELESDRIVVEDKINDGSIPFQNYTNSSMQPITRSADILISEYGALTLEDESDGSLVLNGTDGSSTDAGGRFRFELATDDNINVNYPNV